MKKIAIVTATRAEYGLLAPIIKELREYETDLFKVELIVTGTHLYEQYGKTINEIYEDGVRVDYRIPITIKSDSPLDISNNQADTLVKFTRLFMDNHYDGIVILGDRYEMLAVAIAASNTRTPIFHICGGDTTEGAIDEWIRHSITKMSYLHFPSNEESRRRIIQLGENPARVFNYGSTSIDNILNIANMRKNEALESIGLQECNYALCTYHPVTMEDNSVDDLILEFVKAIEYFSNITFIVTKSNADQGGARINKLLDEYEKTVQNLHVYSSLGSRRYLSLMRYAEFVLGNSSSGIIETPAFGIPTVNIGNRQKGRLQSESIINCTEDMQNIINAINYAMSFNFRSICKDVQNPYGDGRAAQRIGNMIWETVKGDNINLKKTFFNLYIQH